MILFHISPKVFGCTCFVHNVFPGLEKVYAKAIKFLGYFRFKKGIQMIFSNYQKIICQLMSVVL